jgi:Tol biopolymer transport system component
LTRAAINTTIAPPGIASNVRLRSDPGGRGHRAQHHRRQAIGCLCASALAIAVAATTAGAATNGLIAVQTTGSSPQIATLDPNNPATNVLRGLPIDSTDAEWSPDGTMLAFSSTLRGARTAALDPPGGDIYVVSATGGLRLITRDARDEIEPTWSPDGRRIAFVRRPSRPSYKADIYVKDIVGGALRRLTRQGTGRDAYLNQRGHRAPAWSPDGTLIAYSSNRSAAADSASDDPFSTDIWVMAPDGRNKRRLTSADTYGGTYETHPAWSPDSARLAFSSGGPDFNEPYAIDSIDRSGNDARRLTKPFVVNRTGDFTPNDRGLLGHDIGAFPAWSPDGAQIAFAANRELRIMPSSGVFPVDATLLARDVTRPAWARAPTPSPVPAPGSTAGAPVIAARSISLGRRVDATNGVLVTFRPPGRPVSKQDSSALVHGAIFTLVKRTSRKVTLRVRLPGCARAGVRAARRQRRRPRSETGVNGPFDTINRHLIAGTHGTRYVVTETCRGSRSK